MFDIKTITFGYVISNVLVTVFIVLLWQQNRKRYDGLSFWLIAYILQVFGLLLTVPRDVMPEIVTVILANFLIIGGFFFLYMGLERFAGKPRPQIHNYLLLVFFIGLMAYFTFVQADISIRIIIISGAIILLAAQCSDLMLRRVDSQLKPITRTVSFVFILYALAALARIVFIGMQPLAPRADWLQAPAGQALVMLVFQMLNIALTLALILMVMRRLWLDGQAQVAERLRVEETLSRMNERLSLATRAGSLGIWDWDIPKNQLVWDDRMYELYGVEKKDFSGAYEAWLKGIHPDDRAQSDEISRRAQRGEREYDTEFRVVWPDGSIRYLKAYGQFVRDSAGNPIRMTGINYDITERKQADEDLRRAHESVEATNRELAKALEREKLLARTDSLTGVYNRRQFFELAAHEFAVAKRYNSPLTMAIFDIDYLKQVNDTFGHPVGDVLIKCTARIAREQLREADTLARYGGDEFAILLPACNAQEAAIVSQRIRENVAACQIDTGGSKAGVTISLGISEYETGCQLDQLFRQADRAMYAAKEAGRNCIMIYSPDN